MRRTSKAFVVAAALLAIVSAASAQAPAVPPPAVAPGTRSPTPPGEDPAQPTLHDDRDSVDAGMKWLALIDGGKAGAAWDVASQQLKSAVTRETFVAGMREARKPYGKLTARTPERFARSHKMPGAPDGDYVIIEYTAKFANGDLSEHLVWTLESGDVWRVVGYNYR